MSAAVVITVSHYGPPLNPIFVDEIHYSKKIARIGVVSSVSGLNHTALVPACAKT